MKIEKTSVKAKEKEIFKQLRKRFVSIFLDLILLDRIESVSSSNGYALMEYIHQKFDMLLSPGRIYSTLYGMERDGLLEGQWKAKKRIYHVTPEGRATLRTVNRSIHRMKSLFTHLESIGRND